MRARWTAGVTSLVLMVAFGVASPQESAQPPAEAEVARQFEQAAPELFATWKAGRPAEVRALSNGRYGREDLYYCFEFSLCEDAPPPTSYSIDVKKTDSILTPYIGILTIPVKLSCSSRILSSSFKRATADKLAESCIGH